MSNFAELRRICLFAVMAPFLSMLTALSVLRPANLEDGMTIAISWVLTDSLSLLLFTPALLIVADLWRRRRRPTRREFVDWGVVLSGGVAITCSVFFQTSYPLLFVIMPVCLIHAFKLGVHGTAVAILIISAIALGATVSGSGPIQLSHGDLPHHLLILQSFLAVTFIVSLPVAVQIKHREMAEAESRATAARLSNLIEMAPVGILYTDASGLATDANPALLQITGLSERQWRGKGWLSALSDGGFQRAFLDWLKGPPIQREFRQEFQVQRSDDTLCWVDLRAKSQVDSDGEITGSIIALTDMTARKVADEALRRVSERAENAAAAKSAFLAHMSHEIRTPMNGVLGFAELLLAENLTESQRRSAEMIANSGRAMMHLLNDILDITKIEAGKMRISLEPVNLRSKVNTICSLMRANADSKGIHLAGDVAEDVPDFVLGDPLRLRQILLNLVGNAIKFTDAGAVSIGVEVYRNSGREWLRIAVRDTGVGIAPDLLETIFERFNQADATISRRYGGTGLGLTISSDLAALMGGLIEVESKLGQGSEFSLHLPLRRTRQTRQTIANDAGWQLQSAAGTRVLIAEDHDINQALIMAMADQAKLDADLAVDGLEAVDMAKRAAAQGRPYNLVLMDVQMPRMDGLEATRTLRNAGFDAEKLPVIALTANAYAEDIAACKAAGMQAHLAKPLRFRDLVAYVEKYAAHHGAVIAPVAPPPASTRSVEQRYRDRRIKTLEQLRDCASRPDLSDADLATLLDHLHKLAGTAGMFKEAELGMAASHLEHRLRKAKREEVLQVLVSEAGAVLRAA